LLLVLLLCESTTLLLRAIIIFLSLSATFYSLFDRVEWWSGENIWHFILFTTKHKNRTYNTLFSFSLSLSLDVLLGLCSYFRSGKSSFLRSSDARRRFFHVRCSSAIKFHIYWKSILIKRL
jgi:hypothetical protein